MSMTPIRVAFADDHLLMRKSLKSYIEAEGDLIVTQEAENGQQMLDLLQKAHHPPDVCLIDIHMPVMDGVNLLRAIKSRWPSIRCLAITADDFHPLVLRMIRLGINGYLVKNSDPDQVVDAIRKVYSLGYYYSEMADRDTFQMVKSNKAKILELDQEELSFLTHICSDASYEQIAVSMGITVGSVHNIRKKLFFKFNVGTRTSLAVAAIYHRFLPDIIHP